jgi:voltage-gated potassium channel Kch
MRECTSRKQLRSGSVSTKVIEWFQAHREASYTLYGTAPDGAKVKVASVNNGEAPVIEDDAMYKELLAAPGDEATLMASKVITQDEVDRIVAAIKDPQYAEQVARDLRAYVGKTWRAALDAHSKERPKSVD